MINKLYNLINDVDPYAEEVMTIEELEDYIDTPLGVKTYIEALKEWGETGEVLDWLKDKLETFKPVLKELLLEMFCDYMYYGYTLKFFKKQDYEITQFFTDRELVNIWEEAKVKEV